MRLAHIVSDKELYRGVNRGAPWSGAQFPRAFQGSNTEDRVQAALNERFALLTGQSVPIFRCGRKRCFNADRHVLNDQ
jgi:hypothetical protein